MKLSTEKDKPAGVNMCQTPTKVPNVDGWKKNRKNHY